MPPFPDPCLLTSHKPPALLVAELLEATSEGGRVRLLNPAGLDALQLTEACAQAIAVVHGGIQRQHGGSITNGMLVGVKNVLLTRPGKPQETIMVSVVREYAWNSLQLHRASASTSAGEIFSGEFTTALVTS